MLKVGRANMLLASLPFVVQFACNPSFIVCCCYFSPEKIPEPPGRRNRLYLLTFVPSYYEQITLVGSKQDLSARSLQSGPAKPKDFLHLKRSELAIKYHSILKNIHTISLLSSLVKV